MQPGQEPVAFEQPDGSASPDPTSEAALQARLAAALRER
jgi:hypothetical protein